MIPSGKFIERALIESKADLRKQIEIITDNLSEASEEEIFGFEITLREALINAYHYNVMAAQKIIEGNDITDDSFLYFRCKIILYGRIAFQNAIENPNNLFDRVDSITSGELLLNVSNIAFEKKFGPDSDKISPREYGSNVINYDSGSYEIRGGDWIEQDLPKRYSKLWKLYRGTGKSLK